MAIKHSKYSREKIEKADRLWVKDMTLRDVSEILDLPYGTLRQWSEAGWIDKEDSRSYQTGPEADNETLRKVERLLKLKPMRAVSRETGIPRTTIQSWVNRGWVSCEVDWKKEAPSGGPYKANPRLVIEYYYKFDDRTYIGTAREFGISANTVKNYLQKYKNGEL